MLSTRRNSRRYWKIYSRPMIAQSKSEKETTLSAALQEIWHWMRLSLWGCVKMMIDLGQMWWGGWAIWCVPNGKRYRADLEICHADVCWRWGSFRNTPCSATRLSLGADQAALLKEIPLALASWPWILISRPQFEVPCAQSLFEELLSEGCSYIYVWMSIWLISCFCVFLSSKSNNWIYRAPSLREFSYLHKLKFYPRHRWPHTLKYDVFYLVQPTSTVYFSSSNWGSVPWSTKAYQTSEECLWMSWWEEQFPRGAPTEPVQDISIGSHEPFGPHW